MELAILGTGGAVPSLHRDNTALVVKLPDRIILVDCPGSSPQKMAKAGMNFMDVAQVFLTHLHIDHVYGLPSLFHCMWLRGRTETVEVFGPEGTDSAVRNLLQALSLPSKPKFFPVEVTELSREEWCFQDNKSSKLCCLGVVHGVPALGLRIEDKARKTTVAYSGDTEPCENVVKLAKGADVLVHDCTYPDEHLRQAQGHSTASQAGEIASSAGAGVLLLVHLDPVCEGLEDVLIEQARSKFTGRVAIPADGDAMKV
jgi:ribonuclease Z